MERPLWNRIQEIYYSTLPMAQSERSAFVATACDHDPVLAREVNSLLEADDSSDGFLESPVFELALKIIASNNRNGGKDTGASLAENLVGTTIDQRYLVESELGKGGMGKVYLARDLSLHNRPVVIKVLLQTSQQDAYVVKKFKQEVEALARIDHPGVVSVLGAGKLADGKLYIAMQYVSGQTLRSQISSEGMNLERAAVILKQIGEALEDVHEKGIFHRDLKPENIMLQVMKRGPELVKVVDFGIAKVKDSVVAPSTVNDVPVGTVLYMSPEQLRGGERITAASDIYSMAVIAYEMVTGRRPFNPTSAPQLLELHRAGVRVKPIDLRTNLSTEAQAIILRGLSFDPTARYQSATEFGDTLAHALMNEGETAPKPRIAEPDSSTILNTPTTFPLPPTVNTNPESISVGFTKPGDQSRFRKGLLIAAASLLIVLAGGAVWWWAIHNGTKPDNQPEDQPITITPPTRSFTFSLTVQKMRNGKKYQEPYQSTGQETFENDYKFRLNVSSPEPGYLYLFNEGTPQPNGASFTILYPTREINNGSATLGANQVMRTNWNTFNGEPGTENFWIAWSVSQISQLEDAKTEAFKHPDGTLSNESWAAVREYLKSKQEEVKTKIARDKNSQQTTVRGAGDVLVRMVEFQHR